MKVNALLFTVWLFTCFSVTHAQTPKYIVGPGEYNCFILNTATQKAYDVAGGLPNLVGGPSNIVSIAAALHHYALIDNAGNVWAWGNNVFGTVGNGTIGSTTVNSPVQITVDSSGKVFNNVVQVSPQAGVAGYYTMALKKDGTLWAWGSLAAGIRGNGTSAGNVTRPVQIPFPAGTVITKVQGGMSAIALDANGNVWTWGGVGVYNNYYILGQGTSNPNALVPGKVSLPAPAVDVAGGAFCNYALLSNGSLYGWGSHTSWLGIGNSGFKAESLPALNPMLLDAELNFPSPVKHIYVNIESSYAILQDGTLWAWGDNAVGTIGNGQELNFATYTTSPAPTGGTASPYAWDWGQAEFLQQKPVHVGAGLTFTNLFTDNGDIFYAYAEDAQGNLYSWGRDKGAVLGNGVVEGDASETIEAQYPNSWDVPWITKVNPFGLTKISPTSSPYCTSHSGTPCSAEVIPVTANPTVSAGPTQNITKSTTTLTGSATGASGSQINYYLWTEVSGPESAILITLPSGPVATVSGLATGTYVFQLKATDNNWRTSTSNVTVNVNVAPRQPLSVNAGSNVTVQLPASSVTLSGTGSDPNANGGGLSYAWSVLSGPAGSAFSNTKTASTVLSGLKAGSYAVVLTVSDTLGLSAKDTLSVTVLAALPLVPPTAVISNTVMALALPASLTLAGNTSYAPSGTSLTAYQWVEVSGPNTATLATPTAATSAVTGLIAGSYVFKLTVTDGQGQTSSATITITVSSLVGSPLANSGPDQTITLPTNSVTLSGSAKESGGTGTIKAYIWSVISGPTQYALANATSATAQLTKLVAGTYQVLLTVTDNNGKSATCISRIVVNPLLAPTAVIAGKDSVVLLPGTLTLDGSGSSAPAGTTITGYKWTELAGPTTVSFGSATGASSNVSAIAAGTYNFELTVTDGQGLSSSTSMKVRVGTSAGSPLANAGPNQTISMPLDSVSLNAGASRETTGGTSSIVTYSWTVISGPSQYTVIHDGNRYAELTDLVAGVYTLLLTVTDTKGLTATDLLTVTVLPAITPKPEAIISNGKTLVLPGSLSLNGLASKAPNGTTITNYLWTELSGPGIMLDSPFSGSTPVDSLVPGTYMFQLIVSDALGQNDTTSIVIQVSNTSGFPLADAGGNVSINLPQDSAALNGTGSTESGGIGAIVSYDWRVVSGPTQYALSNDSSAVAQLGNLTVGTYTLVLTVTDSNDLWSTDTIEVTVNAPTTEPIAIIANTDTLVTLTDAPLNLMLDGSQSYASPGSTLIGYQWTQLAGPNAAQLTSPSQPTTGVTGLVVGDYLFMLTVTDNLGRQATATIIIHSKTLGLASVSIYPNPVNDNLNVSLGASISGKLSFLIYDEMGNMVQGSTVTKVSQTPSVQTLNVTGLSRGIYFLKIQAPNENATFKFLKVQ